MFIKKFLHSPSISAFASFATIHPQSLQDWQYVSQIHHHLKLNQVDKALTFFINSYLNQQVLDIQIYNTMHKKIKQLGMELSYHEVTYKIYREGFKPHILMKEWMQLLTKSKNKKTLQLLQKDFKYLNLPMLSESQSTETGLKGTEKVENEGMGHNEQKQHSFQMKSHFNSSEILFIAKTFLGRYKKIIFENVQISSTSYCEQPESEFYTDEFESNKNLLTFVNSFKVGTIHYIPKTHHNTPKEGI